MENMATGLMVVEDKSRKEEVFTKDGEEFIRITSDYFEPAIFKKSEYDEYKAKMEEIVKVFGITVENDNTERENKNAKRKAVF